MLPIDTKLILRRWEYYAHNRFAFLTECCKTIDEVAAGGELDEFALAKERPETIRGIPAKPHIKRMVMAWEQQRLIAYLKSRRMIATWALLALDLHLAMFAERAAIYVISTEQEKSDKLLKRVAFMYDNLPSDFPKPKMQLRRGHGGDPTRIDFPALGSFIQAVSQNPNALRQEGATLLHVEELAFWEWPEESWQAMLPTIQGGGKMVVVSTSIANSFFNRLVSDELEQGRGQGSEEGMADQGRGLKIGSYPLPLAAEPHGQGMAGWRNPGNRFYIQLIHYTADPDKRSQEWYVTTRAGYTNRIWEQEYEINPENWEGLPVFSEFIKHYHVSPTPIQWIKSHRMPMLRLWDYGVHACVWAQVRDKQFVVFDARQSAGAFEDNKRYQDFEVQVSGLGLFIDECIILSNEWFPGAVWRDILDPAGWNDTSTHHESPVGVFRKRGINPIKGVQDIETRIASVNEWLMIAPGFLRGFLIDPGAKLIIDAFAGGYSYELRNGKLLPNKGPFSHCLTGDTLVAAPSGAVPIANISVGDIVLTPHGERQVSATMSRIVPEIVEVQCTDGTIIHATADHPFITTTGERRRADSLRIGDHLIKGEAVWGDQPFVQFRNSGVSVATRNPHEATTRVTTPTGTNICIGTKEYRQTLLSTKPDWQQEGKRAGRGTALPLAMSGMFSTRGMLRQSEPAFPFNAPGAIGSILGTHSQENVGFIPTLAKRRPVGRPEWIMNNAPVLFAGLPSRQISTTKQSTARVVASVKFISRSVRVYDLTVEDAHCFYANGVLVGNCSDAIAYGATRHPAPGASRQVQLAKQKLEAAAWQEMMDRQAEVEPWRGARVIDQPPSKYNLEY